MGKSLSHDRTHIPDIESLIVWEEAEGVVPVGVAAMVTMPEETASLPIEAAES